MNNKNYGKKSISPQVMFFILACLISWLIWLPLVVVTQFGIYLPVLAFLHYLGSFGPIMAAIIVSGIYSGKSGLKNFLRKNFNWRVKIRWYLIALLSPLMLFLLSAVINFILGGGWPDILSYGLSDELAGFGLTGTWIFHTITFGIGEETGWRGFALPELQKRRKPLYSSLILSVFVLIWHLPIFFEKSSFMSMGFVEIIGWAVGLVFGSIFLAWLYNNSNGSVITSALWHGAFNTAVASKAASGMIPGIMSMLIIVWAILIISICGPGLKRGSIVKSK